MSKKDDFGLLVSFALSNFEFAKTTKNAYLFRKVGDKEWKRLDDFALAIIKASNSSVELPIATRRDARDVQEHVSALIECEEIPLVKTGVEMGLRVVSKNESAYIDHGSTVYKVSEAGVKTVKPSDAISFEKTPQQLPLPRLPEYGDFFAIQKLTGLPITSIYSILSFMICILAGFTKVMLVLTGAPGSGKSTLARMLKMLIDPETTDLVSFPDKTSDLKLIASKSRVLVLDNLTKFNDRSSDVLCMVVTGGTNVKRTLYTTSDRTVNEFRSSVILTALDKPSQRADLNERMLFIDCSLKSGCRSEKELFNELEELRPTILRGLYDLYHQALKNKDFEPVKVKSRMVDLYNFMGRLEEPLKLERGHFAKLAEQMQENLQHDLAANSVLVTTVKHVMTKLASKTDNPSDFRLKRSNSEMLDLLHQNASKSAFKDSEFPKVVSVLGRKLSEMKSVLKSLGIGFKRSNSTKDGGRTIEFYFLKQQKKKMAGDVEPRSQDDSLPS